MGLSILNNIPSLEAQNQLAITNTNLQNTLFQLSSGSKINSGADDPAGLSIADGLQANISALTQSAQNVTDGVGMLQTADGALSQVTTLLNRAVTLATEAGNAGLTSDQQTALQNEFKSITAEINQIGSNTTYNNTAVFSGSQMSVFLSDGSGADAQDPNISVNMPTLSSSSLGLASYATGTLDLTSNPTAGNTVSIGNQTYTFVAAGQANAAGDVALGNGVQDTLQNLQAAVNGAAGAGNIYGAGTAVNQQATITSVNGGSAVVQALNAGTAGNSVTLSTSITSNVGAGGGTTLSGGADATYDTGALTLTNQPGLPTTATGSVTISAQPDIATSATGIFAISTNPTAGSNSTVTIGSQTYTFVAAGTNGNNDVTIGSGGTAQQNLDATLGNLVAVINGGATAAEKGGTGTDTAAGVAVAQPYLAGSNQVVLTATTPGVGDSLTTGNSVAFSSSIAGAANPGSGSAFLSGGANADTVTVGTGGAAVTYTFVAAGQAVDADQVALGSNVTATLTNLQNAINGTGTASDTTYGAGTAANTAAMVTSVSGNTLNLEAASGGIAAPGAAGNTIDLGFSSPVGAISTSGSTLTGGANADTLTIGAVTYTFVAAGQAQAGNNDVALGATVQATLNNLKAAVNSTAVANGSASTYELKNASMLQGANGAQITSAASGVANVQAMVAGVLGSPIAMSATGTIANDLSGLNGGDLSGGAAATASSGYLALNALPSAGNTVTLGNQTYTFTSGTPAAANQVELGASINATLNNLKAAVNGLAGSGTLYGAGTVQNTEAQITSVTGNQALVTASTAGAAGNALILSGNLSDGAGGGTVGTVNSKLSGGGASVDLNSANDAETALTTIAAAIANVAAQRGAIGSGINQMNAAVNVMNNTSQNLTSSLSGIQDANIGQVVANMSKFQVLEQTGIAALAQANSQEQAVLKLLG